MIPSNNRRRIFIHICPQFIRNNITRAYWLNAVSGMEDMAETHEQMAADIILQVCGKSPEKIFAYVNSKYKQLTGIEYSDASHFIIDLYVTGSEIKALYVRRDLNFVPKGKVEQSIKIPVFSNFPFRDLKDSGNSISNSVSLAKTMLRNSRLIALLKTFCYTYVPTNLIFMLFKLVTDNYKFAFYSASIVPTFVLLVVCPSMMMHFRSLRKRDVCASVPVISLNI